MMNGNGLRIPGWLVAVVLATVAILGVGYNVGAQVNDNMNRIDRLEEQISGLDFRLCRIEKALVIAPYQTCRP